jgi:hypothetical protein
VRGCAGIRSASRSPLDPTLGWVMDFADINFGVRADLRPTRSLLPR